ncbi:MAG: hypothetical protein AAF492_19385, partial [Verrucomicrobiota bacterium]
RLPEEVRETAAYAMLVFTASALLDGRPVGDPLSVRPETLNELPAILPKTVARKTTLWVSWTASKLRFEPQETPHSQPIELPLTDPLLLELQTEDTPPEIVTLRPEESTSIDLVHSRVTLKTIQGDIYTLHRERGDLELEETRTTRFTFEATDPPEAASTILFLQDFEIPTIAPQDEEHEWLDPSFMRDVDVARLENVSAPFYGAKPASFHAAPPPWQSKPLRIFFSFAAEDNLPREDYSGWIFQFENELQTRLNERGLPFEIDMSLSSYDDEMVAPFLEEATESPTIFLLFISERYFQFARHREKILEHSQHLRDRLFPVVLDQIGQRQYSTKVSHPSTGFNFIDADSDIDLPSSPGSSPLFHERMEELTIAIENFTANFHDRNRDEQESFTDEPGPPPPEPNDLYLFLTDVMVDTVEGRERIIANARLRETDDSEESEPFRFEAPLDEAVLRDITWYFNVYPHWPEGPAAERARQIEGQCANWGQQLFTAITRTQAAKQTVENWWSGQHQRPAGRFIVFFERFHDVDQEETMKQV